MAALTGSFAIGYINYADGKTVTATSSAIGYPASNLSSPLLSSSWRSTTGSLSSQNVDVDLGSTLRNVDALALIGTNLEDDAIRQPKLDNNSSTFGSAEYNPGSGSAFDVSYEGPVTDISRYGRNLIIFTGQTYSTRYSRITLTDPGNPSNYLSARVYWAGPIWQPSVSFGVQEGKFRKRRELVGSPGLQRYISVIEVDFDALTEAEGRALEAMCSAKLGTGRLLVIPRPGDPATWQSESLYCRLAGLPTLTSWPQGSGEIRWKLTLTFRECED